MVKAVSISTGLPTEVEVAQVAAPLKSVQYNDNGQLGGAASTFIDADGHINKLIDNTSITTPSSGYITEFISNDANRANFSFIDQFSQTFEMQSSLMKSSVWYYASPASSSNPLSFNITVSTSGGATVGASFTAGSNQNHITTKPRYQFTTSALFSDVAYGRSANRFIFINTATTPVSPNLGVNYGFTAVFKFNREEANILTDARLFIGVNNQNATNPTNVNPSTIVNSIAMIKDDTDTTWHLFCSSNTLGTKINLGANFPCNTNTDLYELILHSPMNSGRVFYKVTRINTNNIVEGEFPSNTLPNTTVFLAPRWWVANNTALAAATLSLHYTYGESPL